MRELFALAKGIMRAQGNRAQWTGDYPSVSLLQEEITLGHSFVCVDENDTPVGTFALIPGPDPTYARIEGGAWLDDKLPYAVIHRIAGTPQGHGVAAACFAWAAQRFDNLRIDTHKDNAIMRHLMQKHGFSFCGIIYLANGDPRLAYQRIARGGLPMAIRT